MAKQRIGVFFSSFDPFHRGHLAAVNQAMEAEKMDRVLMVLSFLPWEAACVAGRDDRWRMLVTGCSGNNRLIPFLPDHADMDPGSLLPILRKKYADSKLLPITDPAFVSSPAIHDEFAAGLSPREIDVPIDEFVACQGLYGAPARVPEAREWLASLFPALKPRRFAHSLAVADTARRMALRFGEDPLKAEQAGLLHDCAKSVPLPEMQQIALENRLDADEAFLNSSALLHSVVGAWMAEHRYGVTDLDVLEAIRYHNTGCAGMSRLAVCVALADSIEPTREPYPYLQEIRDLSHVSLEKSFLLSLERTASYVQAGGAFLHPRTMDTIAWLKKQGY